MISQPGVRREASAVEYQGLIRVVTMVARHPEFPGKKDAMDEYVEDIEDRCREGRLTPSQRSELLSILLAGRAADAPRWHGLAS